MVKNAQMRKIQILLCFFIFSLKLFAASDPYYIKSVAFTQGNESLIPIFRLNESFQFSFDDLLGTENDYYYKIVHCDRNWNVSNIKITEYLNGMQNLRLSNYVTSFNTFQRFVHYQFTLPNRETQLTISGNYILEIYNDRDEKVIERKFVLYEDVVSVGMAIKKTRDLSVTAFKQNIDLTIDFGEVTLQNPKKNIGVTVLQNGQWSNALKNLKPQYIIGNQFRYQYDKESNFWAGNEYLHFDTSDIRNINNNVAYVLNNDLYETHLKPRAPMSFDNGYTFHQDVNGAFKPRNRFKENAAMEADYSWVYFSYELPKLDSDKKLFVVGMFSNYQLTNDYELTFDTKINMYRTALLVKQGFTNYKYVIAKNDGTVLEDLNPDGNYYETENVYHALVYFKNDADRYDRVIGLGKADSKLITN